MPEQSDTTQPAVQAGLGLQGEEVATSIIKSTGKTRSKSGSGALMHVCAIAGIVLIAALAGWVFLPFMPPFIWALVMARVVRPFYLRTLRHCSATVAAGLMVLLVTVAVILPLSFLGGKLVYEASRSYHAFEQQFSLDFSPQSAWELVDRLPLPDAVHRYLASYELDERAAVTYATEYGKKAVALLSNLATSAAVGAGGFFFASIAFLGLFYFACKDGEHWYQRVVGALPSRFGLEPLFERLGTGASSLFWGVAGTCLLQGVAGGIIFLIMGLPSPFIAGSLMAICALLPVVGTALVWLPAAVWLAITGAWGKALFLIALGGGVIGTMDNITRPLLAKAGGGQMSILVVTTGAIGGIAAFGLTGIIVGPLALEAFSWLLDHLGDENPDRH
jgi:predicted PurR-regulated permease PerM